MDPVRSSPHAILGRFPRTRGDGPRWAILSIMLLAFPPHTRGWTANRWPADVATYVSPAHAGMDPRLCAAGPLRPRFPRTRGDGPCMHPMMGKMGLFPPHTRGWTVETEKMNHKKRVSPAHAGMDPERCRPGIRRRCFPRTRGDGPRHQAARTVMLQVSPAHAGMDRTWRRRARTPRFPRTRGDGPGTDTFALVAEAFPPHTRGWTHARVQHGRRAGVSPAHAGMDPRSSTTRTTSWRFPRTRGDGPPTGPAHELCGQFPPHTRGWTDVIPPDAHILGVSPAHAGMDPPEPTR